MQLTDLFDERHTPLLACANALDDGERFRELVTAQPLDETLARAVRSASRAFAERAGIDDGELTSGAFGGQQPYVDYYPAVPAKLDALDECGGFYAFAEYAPLGSDPWMARSELPSVTAAGGLLRLVFHRPLRAHEGKDLRFVPVPSIETLRDIEEKLKAMISATARVVTIDRKVMFARLRLLLADYEFAREHAANAGEFNAIWSARTFRRLGLRAPLLSLTDLTDALIPSIAETLAIFIRERRAVAECVREALADDETHALHFTGKRDDHVPLAIADERGVRKLVRFGGHLESDVAEFLHANRGRWSLDVFAPLFLFRAGVTGIVNGRGSIRYSLVLAKVMQRLFGIAHPPNLLCSCSPAPAGPFAEAVRRTLGDDAVRGCEPTLIQRLLYDEPQTIRREIAESWR